MDVFWSNTYEGASIAQLTEAMGISAPSLYAAFGDKAALFREALGLYLERYGDAIWAPLEAAPAARDGVARLLAATAEAYSRPDTPRGCMVVLGAQHGGLDDPVRSDLRARRLANWKDLEARMRRGVAEGDVPPTFDIPAAAAFYMAVQTGMSVLARDGADREALCAAAAGAMQAWDGFDRNSGTDER
ncbi:TetR/AcrR family transcriptional regulator [Phenylobacterium terrae]|uniref:TetR/AcrR family transcriptional regulator n=1 Tax=Phenylobacterium terrae TaxID=2665495 RepID=A0ABW4N718_9CAUL